MGTTSPDLRSEAPAELPDGQSARDPRALSGPLSLTAQEWKAALVSTFKELADDDVASLASGVAFRIFLSLIPALIAAVAIFRLVAEPETISRLVEQLRGLVPGAASTFLVEQISAILETDRAATGGIAVIAVGAGLFAATSAAAALIKALNRAYDLAERRKFLAQRGIALVITLALFLSLVGLVVLLVLGPQLTERLVPEVLYRNGIALLVGVARYAGAIALVALLFGFVYWLGPNRERADWRWHAPGALLGVAGWLALSYGFSLYAREFGSFNQIYGTLAGIVVLLLWLQLSMLVLLVGAELNCELEKVRATSEGLGAVPADPQEVALLIEAPRPPVRRTEDGGASARDAPSRGSTASSISGSHRPGVRTVITAGAGALAILGVLGLARRRVVGRRRR